jgi:hypothetical protein
VPPKPVFSTSEAGPLLVCMAILVLNCILYIGIVIQL